MLTAGFMTLADLKARILPETQEGRTQWDTDLQDIGKGVVELFNQHCNRVFPRTVGAVYDVTADRSSLCLDALPVETVTSVVTDCAGVFTDITADILTTGKKSGILEFGYVLGSYRDRVTVTFTGGFWLDDGGSMPAGATPLPADVLDAYVRQCQSTVEKTGLFHTAGLRRAEKEDSGSNLDTHDLLPGVMTTLKKYYRYP